MRPSLTVIALALALLSCEKPDRPAPAAPSTTTRPLPTPPDPPLAIQSASATATAAPSAAPTRMNGTAPDRMQFLAAAPDMDVLSLVRAKRLEAKANGRVLVVYVGATWCPPCREFHRLSRSGYFDARAAKIALLEFDEDEDQARLKAAGYTYRFIPFFILPGPTGAPLESLEIKGKAGEVSQQEILRNLEAWQSRP